MEDLRVAAVSMLSDVGNKAANLSRMERLVRQAAEKGAKAVCFPEMNITGYALWKNPGEIAETIPGPCSEAVRQMAQKNEVLILAGLAEKREERVFISHFAAAPEGIFGIYRKTHLATVEEGIYEPGEECPVFRYRGAAFGIQLCFDGHFPELSTFQALNGAEILFFPHASPRESAVEKRGRWLRYLSARAYDNSVFVVACNPTGRTEDGLSFPGAALVIDPKGGVLAASRTAEEETILADLRRETFLRVRENSHGFFLSRRRPDLYRTWLKTS